MKNFNCLTVSIFAFVLLGAGLVPGAVAARSSGRGRNQEYQARRQLKRAKDLLAMGEEERGLKLLQNIPRLFPKSKAKYMAQMELGKHFVKKKEFARAVKQFNPVLQSEDDAVLAEALYEIGKSYYFLNQYNNAFSYLRKVTTKYYNSVYANQAYYYIGMCHFVQKHWKKAIEALKMVGTAVGKDDEGSRFMEAGQRFFIKIHDKDLVVLASDDASFQLPVSTKRGDHETVNLSVLDRAGEYYIGSIPTAPGVVKENDGILEIAGGDQILVTYTDANTADGRRFVKKEYKTQVVSTGTVSLTDGAYANIVKGVFLGQDFFVRVTDLDLDLTDQKDKATVRLQVKYLLKPQGDDQGNNVARTGVDINDKMIQERDSISLELVETKPHSGVFVGSMMLTPLAEHAEASTDDQVLNAIPGDTLHVEYDDALSIDGDIETTRTYTAKVLGGAMNDVMAQVRVVSDDELKARKSLIEVKALKELAGIFKSVGLMDKAREKAKEGLEKINEIILNRKTLPGKYIEQALQMKWDIYLVIGQLQEAIQTCRELMTLFPQSTLVDQAMVKIGQANLEAGNYQQAISIFSSILALPKSDQQAFASYSIGEAYEKMAAKTGKKTYLTNAMLAFQKCAERFPNSLYAGQALDKVANFYLKMKDYKRAVDLMENISQDFPDLDIMDKILLKWAIALYRLKNYQGAYDKLTQLIDDYPQSTQAQKARKYRRVIAKKLK